MTYKSHHQKHSQHPIEYQRVTSGPHRARLWCCFCQQQIAWADQETADVFIEHVKQPFLGFRLGYIKHLIRKANATD